MLYNCFVIVFFKLICLFYYLGDKRDGNCIVCGKASDKGRNSPNKRCKSCRNKKKYVCCLSCYYYLISRNVINVI